MISSVRHHATAAAAMLASLTPVHAQSIDPVEHDQPLSAAAGVEIWTSADSDKTDVRKLTGRALWNFDGPTRYQGIDIERAWFSPEGQRARKQTRVYVDVADSLNSRWQWSARIGTNGNTILGSASVRSADWSKEIFTEREIVETPRGLDQGIYYTFAGASMDLVSRERDTVNAMLGLQKFTGKNERLHLRATYVHVIKPSIGLSIQLRTRYFHSTFPGEFDYYSPRDFVQLVPVVQVRRFSTTGWMYLVALGFGAQKATTGSWQGARLADMRIESPAGSRKLEAFAQLQYSNNSLMGAARNYHYVVARLGFARRL